MPTDQIQEPGLPNELAAELRLLAAIETNGSRPFPRVNAAIRRRRITRYGGGVVLVAAVAAAVLAVEVLTGGAFDRADRQGVPVAPTPSAAATNADLAEAGYGTGTSGSLGDDQVWLNAFSARVRASAAEDSHRRVPGDPPKASTSSASSSTSRTVTVRPRFGTATESVRPGRNRISWWPGPGSTTARSTATCCSPR